MLSNAYFLAKFRFDTAENEPAKNLQYFANFPKFANSCRSARRSEFASLAPTRGFCSSAARSFGKAAGSAGFRCGLRGCAASVAKLHALLNLAALFGKIVTIFRQGVEQ